MECASTCVCGAVDGREIHPHPLFRSLLSRMVRSLTMACLFFLCFNVSSGFPFRKKYYSGEIAMYQCYGIQASFSETVSMRQRRASDSAESGIHWVPPQCSSPLVAETSSPWIKATILLSSWRRDSDTADEQAYRTGCYRTGLPSHRPHHVSTDVLPLPTFSYPPTQCRQELWCKDDMSSTATKIISFKFILQKINSRRTSCSCLRCHNQMSPMVSKYR